MNQGGPKPVASVYEFGRCVLDVPAWELRRDGHIVSLSVKAFTVLALLLYNRRRVVSRHELFDSAWGDVVVADGSLTQAIWQIRSAIDDGPNGASLVRTVRGRGYRFVGQVIEREQLGLDVADSVPQGVGARD